MSTDTMLGNKDRGHVIDWKRVADSYRDDLATLLAAGNDMRRAFTDGSYGPQYHHPAVTQWDAAVVTATAAEGPICIHQGSGDGVPATEQAGATSMSAGLSVQAQPTLPFDMGPYELVRRAVRNARPRKELYGGSVRWSVVGDLFALGSTYATHLCRHFGVNPEDMLGKLVECPECGGPHPAAECDNGG